MSYPDHFVRGVRDRSHVPNGGPTNPALFYFDRKSGTLDNAWEMSINWQDNYAVIAFTLDQRRTDGEHEFKVGCIVVSRQAVDGLAKLPTMRRVLSYERKPVDDNPYHGNLLLAPETPKAQMKAVAAALTLCVVDRKFR